MSGKPLVQMEAPKLIEDVYKADGGKLKANEQSALVVFDTISEYNKKGMLNDIPLDKLEDFYRYQGNQYKEGQAKASANRVKAKVISQMSKAGYYPLGGQGDKGRIIFVKHHPNTLKLKKTAKKKAITDIKAALRRSGTMDKKATQLLNDDMAKAKKEYDWPVIEQRWLDLAKVWEKECK